MKPDLRWAIVFVAVAALIALAQFHVRQIVSSSILYDDAHNANVAKNLAMGFGYSTSYHEIVPFNPEASTGPVVLLPAAALVRAFGNRHGVPTLAIVLCIWATLALVLFLLRSYLTAVEWLAATALITLGLMLFHAREFGLLGDVPAALLACASILVACGPGRSSERLVTAGLLLGLAIEAKLYAALVVPSPLLYAMFAPAEDAGAKCSIARRSLACVAFLSGVLAPILAWEIWQFVAMGSSVHGWVALKLRHYSFFEIWSGVGEVQQSAGLGQLLHAKISRGVSSLGKMFGPWPSLVAFALVLALGIGATVRAAKPDRGLTRLRALILVLLAASVTHLVWWLTLSREGWYRHLLPCIVYFLMTGILAALATFRLSRAAGMVAVALLLLGWSSHFHNVRVVFNRQFGPEPRLTALLAARDAMVELARQPDTVFVGYGWWVPRDLEYLLPTIGNFKDAARLAPPDVAGKRIVLVRNEYFNWEKSPALRAFQTACDQHMLFRRDPFVISMCPSLPPDSRTR